MISLQTSSLQHSLKAATICPTRKTVSIEVSKEQNKALLKIKDEVTGIADEEKKKVFGKFYRSGNEAIRKTKGTGLGLYLCRRIAESHKAKIKITDNQSAGSIFTVEFNAA